MAFSPTILAVPVLILLNAFFVGAEYALVAIRQAQISELRQRGWKRASAAMERLTQDTAGSLAAVQVCITMTNLLLGWLGEPAMNQLLASLLGTVLYLLPANVFEAISTIASFMLVTFLTVVLSELLPKAITLKHVRVIAAVTAVPLLWIRRVINPLVWAMNATANAVSRPLGLGRVQDLQRELPTMQDLIAMTTQAAAEGVVSGQERSLVLNALGFGRRTAKQIMVPRTQVAYLDLRWPMEQNRRVMDAHLYSRLPLCDGGMDHVIGIVRTKEFLSAYNEAGDTSVLSLIALPPIFVPEKIALDRLLGVLQQESAQMVFLVDEYGGVEGLVTLRDVVDELFGDASSASVGT